MTEARHLTFSITLLLKVPFPILVKPAADQRTARERKHSRLGAVTSNCSVKEDRRRQTISEKGEQSEEKTQMKQKRRGGGGDEGRTEEERGLAGVDTDDESGDALMLSWRE